MELVDGNQPVVETTSTVPEPKKQFNPEDWKNDPLYNAEVDRIVNKYKTEKDNELEKIKLDKETKEKELKLKSDELEVLKKTSLSHVEVKLPEKQNDPLSDFIRKRDGQ